MSTTQTNIGEHHDSAQLTPKTAIHVSEECETSSTSKTLQYVDSPSTVAAVQENDNTIDEEHRKDVEEPPGPSSSIQIFRDKCGDIVNSEFAQNFVLVLIIVNSIMMGISTFEIVWSNDRVSHAFDLTDKIFLCIFTVELGMQIIYHGHKLFYDGWLVFDFCIVLLSWVFHNLQIIRAFRIIRALRLINHVTLIRDLVEAMLSTFPRMAGITAMTLLVFYVFAVMFTQLFKGLELEEPYFVTLDASFFTLFQMMTLDWAGIARECMAIYPWAWAPFLFFISVSSFIVFNLIIAVICDAVAYSNNEEENKVEERLREKVGSLSEKISEMQQSEQRIQQSLDFLARQVQLVAAVKEHK